MSSGMRSLISSILQRLSRRTNRDPRLPSLVKALQKIAPRAVIKEVVGTASDRRQWGVLTAAWLGVSEKELMQAVAKELKLDFVERVPRVQGVLDRSDAKELLQLLRNCAAVPLFDGVAVTGFVAVDPAEVRGIPLYTGDQTVSLGCWSEIVRALDDVEKDLRDRDEGQARDELKREESLCARVVDVILEEARMHGASSVEIVTLDGSSRYQFITGDGKRGFGNIHKGIVPTVLRYLARLDGATHRASDQSEVVVKSLGNLTNFKLLWTSARVTDAPLAIGFDPQARAIQSEPPLPQESAPTEGGAASPVVVEQQTAASNQTPVVLSSAPGHGEPILVIDDNPMFCRVLERLLQRDGFMPSFAENGVIGIERLEECQHMIPKAIVCDLHMPRMNGKEFVEHVRQDSRFHSIPIVMLTSDDDAETEVALLGIGADAFVSKTRDPRVLCAQIRRLLQQGSARVAA